MSSRSKLEGRLGPRDATWLLGDMSLDASLTARSLAVTVTAINGTHRCAPSNEYNSSRQIR